MFANIQALNFKHFLAQTLTNTESFGVYLEPIIQTFNPSWRYDTIRAKVISVKHENENIYTLSLKPNSKWKIFEAGQFIQLTVEKDGSLLTRPFSISSSPGYFKQSGLIELSIRIQAKGLITPWLAENLHTGSTVYLSQAMGEFTLKSSNKPKLFIVAGSGITPIRAMLNEHINSSWLKEATLLFYVRNHAELLFSSDIKAYQGAGLNCQIIYTEESGHICKQHLTNYCPEFSQYESYICGPGTMIEATTVLLRAHNVKSQHIHFEYFGSAPLTFNPANEEGSELDEIIQVDYLTSNKQVKFNANNLPQTLLDMAEQEGLKPVSGCRMGICHQCICKKKQGRVYNTKTGKISDSGAEEIQLCLSVPVGHVELEL